MQQYSHISDDIHYEKNAETFVRLSRYQHMLNVSRKPAPLIQRQGMAPSHGGGGGALNFLTASQAVIHENTAQCDKRRQKTVN